MTAIATPNDRPDLPDLDRFRKHLSALGNCTKRTAGTYTAHARLAIDWFTANRPGLPLLDITAEDIEDYVMDLDERGLSTASRRLAIYALRKFYDWHGRNVAGFANPAKQVRAPKQYSSRPDPYGADELARLLQAPLDVAAGHEQGSPRWVRAHFDHVVLAMFRYTGLRLTELIDLETSHIRLTTRRFEVRRGKGNKQRHAPIPPLLLPILEHYLTQVRPLCPPSPRLFANPDGYEGTAVYGALAPRAAFDIVVKYAGAAGLEGVAHPHRMRHSYATDLFRKGVPLNVISALLGHSSLLTTIRYLALTRDDLQTAVDDAFALPDPGVDTDDGEGDDPATVAA